MTLSRLFSIVVSIGVLMGLSHWSLANDAAKSETPSARPDRFRFDVVKVFTKEEIIELCDRNLGADTPEARNCHDRRPAYVTSRATAQELARYKAVITVPKGVELLPRQVIDLEGTIAPGSAILRFVGIACAADDQECRNDRKRGSTGKLDPNSMIGDVE
jgi:hypothetical protein